MSNIVYILIYSFILVSSLIYIWHKMLNKKVDFKNHKIYVTLFGLMIISILNYFLIDKFVKIVLITIVFTLFFYYLFKENIKKCIITPIYYQLIIMISEGLLIVFIVSVLKLDLNQLKIKFLGTFFINVGTAIISIIISFIPITSKIYNIIIRNITRINNSFLIIFSIISMSFANILAMTTYYKVEIKILIIVNIIYSLFCCIIVFYSFKTKNNYNKVNDKYNIAINSLKDYEEIMKKYRVANHENKNLLLAIRTMIVNNDKEITKYIDSIIKNKYNDNEKLLQKVNKIPTGGLRATIYSEILKIKDKKIKYELNIDNSIKTIDLINIDTNIIIDICKILGVFIDNAIEEVEKLKKRIIIINIYKYNEELLIDVTNNYSNKIEITEIYNDGYTTKGKNHGYGLSLVKKILDNNPNIENNMSINKNYFTQSISIKYKNIYK